MHSVTSNAVADCFSYHSTPKKIGKWIDGVSDIYKIQCTFTLSANGGSTGAIINNNLINKYITKISGSVICLLPASQLFTFPICAGWDSSMTWGLNIYVNSADGGISYQRGTASKAYENYVYIDIEYIN